MIEKITGYAVPAVGASIGFEPVTMLIKERGLTFNAKQNLALIYDKEEDIKTVFEIKQKLMQEYNVSLFVRPKNIKNFYDKIVEVADCVISTKEFLENKPVKILQKDNYGKNNWPIQTRIYWNL